MYPVIAVKFFQSQSDLSQDKLSRLHCKIWVILHQGEEIPVEVLINKSVFFFIFVDVSSEARPASDLMFELPRVLEDRLGNRLQDEGSVLTTTRCICPFLSAPNFGSDLEITRTYCAR